MVTGPFCPAFPAAEPFREAALDFKSPGLRRDPAVQKNGGHRNQSERSICGDFRVSGLSGRCGLLSLAGLSM